VAVRLIRLGRIAMDMFETRFFEPIFCEQVFSLDIHN
jgi:hypothetical protein